MKLFVDKSDSPPKGWDHLRDGNEFKLMLNSIKYSDIEIINFGNLECEDVLEFNEADCVTQLIEKANGRPLPTCVIKANTENTKIIKEIIEHYNDSYKYTTDCVIIN